MPPLGLESGVAKVRALLALHLLSPRRAVWSPAIVIAFIAAAGLPILIGLKLGQNIFGDSAEAYVWGQQFLGGYGRHPPMTGWIANLWYQFFPAENWSSYVLSRTICAISLMGIYLVARCVLDARRALFVVLIMAIYPLLLGAKSDRYNNYQVLQAVIPFAVYFFLRAFRERTALWSILFGLACAAASLTIYSGLFVALAAGLAAMLHRDRIRFLSSKAPYIAVAAYLLVLSPHVIWLIEHDYASVRFAGRYIDQIAFSWRDGLGYLLHHAALIAVPLAIGLVSLWPLRLSARASERAASDQSLQLIVMVIVLVIGPVLAFAIFSVRPTVDWGNPFFTLLPVAILAAAPRIVVTRRAVANSAMMVVAAVAGYLMVAAIYPWTNFRERSGHSAYAPTSELAQELTGLWRVKQGTSLAIVAAEFALASEIAFYSADHPRTLPDFTPAQAPWLKYPSALHALGYVGLCSAGDQSCADQLLKLDPEVARAEQVQLTVQRRFAGIIGPPYIWAVWIVRPRS